MNDFTFKPDSVSHSSDLMTAFGQKLDSSSPLMQGSGVVIDSGPTSARPSASSSPAATNWMMWGNTDINQVEMYINGTWYQLTGTSSGSKTPPGPATNLVASNITTTSIQVSWNAPTSGDGPFSYSLNYRVSGTTAWTAFANTSSLSATVTGLTAGTTYDFQIITTGAVAPNSTSATLSAATKYVAPTAPQNVTIGTETSTTIPVSWKAPVQGTSPTYTAQAQVSDQPTGTVLYVATTGNDSTGNGSSGSPYATIQKASTVAAAGDTILVESGDYVGGFTTTASGTSGNPITYKSKTKWGARIVCAANNPARTFAWTNGNSGTDGSVGEYVVIDGFDIDGTTFTTGTQYQGGIYATGNFNTIQNCRVHDLTIADTNGGSGVEIDGYYGGVSGTIINNFVYNILPGGSDTPSLVHGVYISCNGCVCYNNLVINDDITSWHGANALQIYNNTLVNGIGILIGSGDVTDSNSGGGHYQTGGCDNCNVFNNIVWNGTQYGIEEEQDTSTGGAIGTHNAYSNNILFQCAEGATLMVHGSPVDTITSDPLFVNPTGNSSGDYHLTQSSPAVNAGLALLSSVDAPSRDLDGNVRPSGSGYDIGCYEYGASPPNGTFTSPSTSGLSYTFTGLTSNTVYAITVTASNPAGSATSVAVDGATTAAATSAPSAPTNLVASNVTGNGLTLSWTASAQGGSVSYQPMWSYASGVAGAVRDPAYWPGNAQSVWNSPIGSGAQWSQPGDADQNDLTSMALNINYGNPWGADIIIGTASDPLVPFTWPDQNNNNVTQSYHCPANAQISPTSDAGMFVFDTTQNIILSLGNCTFNNGSDVTGGVTAKQGETDNTCGIMEDAVTGNMGFDVALGTMRHWEVDPTQNPSGEFRHMLRFDLDASLLKNTGDWATGIAWPQTHADYGEPGYTGNVQPGATIGIPASVNLDSLGLSQGGLMLARALQRYGAMWRDVASGGVVFFGELQDGGNLLLQQMQNDGATILPYLRILRNQGPSTPNGGGTWLVPGPPPLNPTICPSATGGNTGGAPMGSFAAIGNATSETSINITGLQPNTPYYFEVKATNNLGNATSSFITVTTSASGTTTPSGGGSSTPTTYWNTSDATSGMTFSSDDLTVNSFGTNPTPQSVRSNTSRSTGKLMFEIKAPSVSNDFAVGLANSTYQLDQAGGLGADANSVGYYIVSPTQGIYYNSNGLSFGSVADTAGTTITVCSDNTNQLIWVTSDAMEANVGAGAWNNSLSADPGSGSGGLSFSGLSGDLFICFNDQESGGTAVLNTGASSFKRAMPGGFSAWDAGSSSGGGTSTGKPSVTGPTSETVAVSSVVDITGIQISDSAANGNCTLAMSCSAGTVTATINGSPVSGSGTSSITYTNTLANCQTVASSLTYTAGSSAGSDTVAVSFTDQLQQNSTIHVAITINAKSGTGSFYISNGAIIDPDGKTYTALGINAAPPSTPSDSTAIAPLFPGITFVRAAIEGWPNLPTPDSLDTWITNLTNAKIVVLVENHPWPELNALTGSDLQTESNWYASFASYYKDNPYVWFASMNEPQGEDTAGDISRQHVATYNAVRNAGSNTMVLFDPLGGGNPGQCGPGPLTASSYSNMTNAGWDLHFYGWVMKDANGNLVTDNGTAEADLQGSASTNTGVLGLKQITSADGQMPVVNAEIGAGGWEAQWPAVLNAASVWALQQSPPLTSGFGVWQWAPDSDPNDTLTQNDNSLTTYGQQVAAAIKNAPRSNPTLIQAPLTGTVTAGTWQYGDLQFNGTTHGYIHYAMLLPDGYSNANTYPVLVYEHQNDEGDDWYNANPTYPPSSDPTANTIVMQDVINGTFNNISFRTDHPCIVLVMFCDQTADTSGSNENFGGSNDTAGQNPNENAVVAVVQHIWATENCYQPKTYIMGESLGGWGTIAAMLDYNRTNGPYGKIYTAGFCLSGAIAGRSPDPASDQPTIDRMKSVLLFCVAGSGDDTPSSGADNNDYERPMWTAITGNQNYPQPPGVQGGSISGCQAAGTNYYYAEDTTLGHNTWNSDGNGSNTDAQGGGHSYGLYPNDGKPFFDWLFEQEVS